jgi:hypothetical protein
MIQTVIGLCRYRILPGLKWLEKYRNEMRLVIFTEREIRQTVVWFLIIHHNFVLARSTGDLSRIEKWISWQKREDTCAHT